MPGKDLGLVLLERLHLTIITLLGRGQAGDVRLESIGRLGVAKPGLMISARDVLDPAVADIYHGTILKHMMLYLASVHEGTIGTPKINELNTV